MPTPDAGCTLDRDPTRLQCRDIPVCTVTSGSSAIAAAVTGCEAARRMRIISKRRSTWRIGTRHPITTDNTLSVGGAYSFRDGWQGQRDDEHANRPDAVP